MLFCSFLSPKSTFIFSASTYLLNSETKLSSKWKQHKNHFIYLFFELRNDESGSSGCLSGLGSILRWRQSMQLINTQIENYIQFWFLSVWSFSFLFPAIKLKIGKCLLNEEWLSKRKYLEWLRLCKENIRRARCCLCKKDLDIANMTKYALK